MVRESAAADTLDLDQVEVERASYIAVIISIPVFILAAIAAVPWIRWRFRLRTLLIATTLVAVVLGLVLYAVRN
jgi:hypothetical protein